MTLNSSGRISIGTSIYSSTNANIEVELGKSGTTQVSLNDTDARALAKITGNNTQIKFSDFYGKMTGSYAISAQTSSGTVLSSSNPVGYNTIGAATPAGTTFKVVFDASNYINNKTFYVRYSGNATTSDYSFTSDTLSPSTVIKSTSGDTTTYDFTNTNNAAVSVAMNYTVSSDPIAPFGNGSSSLISSNPYVEWRLFSDSGLTKLLATSSQGIIQRKITSFYAIDSLGTTITSISASTPMFFYVRSGPISGKFNVRLPDGSYLPSSNTYYSLDASGGTAQSVTLTTPGTGTYTAYFYNSAGASTGVYVDLTFTVTPNVSVSVTPTSGYVGIPITFTVTAGPANGTYYFADQYGVASSVYNLNSSGGSTQTYTPVAAGTFTWEFRFSDGKTYTISNYLISESTFVYAGSGTYTLTIPSSGVGSVELDVIGGGGGTSSYHDSGYSQVSRGGGLGGAVTGLNVTVTPSTNLTIVVGSAGGPGYYSGANNTAGVGASGGRSVVYKPNSTTVVDAGGGLSYPTKTMSIVVTYSGVGITSTGTTLSLATQTGTMSVSDSTVAKNGPFNHYSLFESLQNSLYNTTTHSYPPASDPGWDKLGRYNQVIDSNWAQKGLAERTGYVRVKFKP